MPNTPSPATIYSNLRREATRPRKGPSTMKTITTTHYARAAHTTNTFKSTARAEGSVAGLPNAPAADPKRSARAYEGFLEMPVVVVVLVMWVAGAVLLSSCALALYMAGSLLVSVIGGAL